MSSLLARCVGDVEKFLERHWGREPVHSRGVGTGSFDDLFSLQDIDEILTDRLIRYPDLRLIRGGKPLDVRSFTRVEKQDVGPSYLVPDVRAVYDEFHRGATLLLQGVHRYWAPLRSLCREVEEVLGFPVQCNVFVTPGRAQGLATHIDLYDSVVLHTYGHKDWQVFAPAVEAPIDGLSMARGQQMQGPLLIEPRLSPGDSLYIPRGFPHAASTSDSASVHATLLIFGRSWLEVLADLIRSWGEREVQFRRWIPAGLPPGSPKLRRAVASQLAALSRWVAGLDEEQVASWMRAEYGVGAQPGGVAGLPLAGLVALDELSDASVVAVRPGLAFEIERVDESLSITLPDRIVQVPQALEPVMKRLTTATGDLTVGDLSPWLDQESRLVLVRRLVREGFLMVLDRSRRAVASGKHRAVHEAGSRKVLAKRRAP